MFKNDLVLLISFLSSCPIPLIRSQLTILLMSDCNSVINNFGRSLRREISRNPSSAKITIMRFTATLQHLPLHAITSVAFYWNVMLSVVMLNVTANQLPVWAFRLNYVWFSNTFTIKLSVDSVWPSLSPSSWHASHWMSHRRNFSSEKISCFG